MKIGKRLMLSAVVSGLLTLGTAVSAGPAHAYGGDGKMDVYQLTISFNCDNPTFCGQNLVDGWSGDAVHINGYDLAGASVAISSTDAGVSMDGPAAISSDTNTDLWFTLPTIHSTTVGPVGLTFPVNTPKGTAKAAFTLSPALHTDGYQAFPNSGGGQNGQAWASADVNRTTGTVSEWAKVENDQYWLSISVNISMVWLDAQNRVIGFTAPQNVTVAGNYTLFGHVWQSGPITWQGSLGSTVIGPNPGAGPWIHSAQLVMVRDHSQELISTLTTAFQSAPTIDFVWSHLPH